MKVLEKIKIVSNKVENNSTFSVIILKCKTNKNSFAGKLLGRGLEEWVSFACRGHDIKIVDYNSKENILNSVRGKINNRSDYTIILLSSTPLLQTATINDIKEYCHYKNIGVCKLPAGYVVNNNIFLGNEKVVVDSVYSQNIDDFYMVENKKQYTYALQVLQGRINNFHLDNGVEILDINKVYIEPFVDIERGAIIYPNNSLKGNSYISSKVILKENNVIENSSIGKDSCISGSVITDCIIGDEVFISPFCEITNSKIHNESIIGKGASINNYIVSKGSKIEANKVLGDKDDSDSRTR